MQIENIAEKRFEEMKKGDCFLYNNYLYLVVDNYNGENNVVNLSHNYLDRIRNKDLKVMPVKAMVIVEKSL